MNEPQGYLMQFLTTLIGSYEPGNEIPYICSFIIVIMFIKFLMKRIEGWFSVMRL